LKTSTTPPVVEALSVSRRFGADDAVVDALTDVSLQFDRQTLTAIMGPSGSGKSTLMHILAGLDRPTHGAVTIDGQTITTMGDKQLTLLRRRKIGFVFQFFNLIPSLSAEENIILPLKISGEKLDRDHFSSLVETMRLSDRLSHKPSELSGGQQQRVAIARALIAKPAVVFADEPTGNLDSTATAEVLTLLRRAVDDLGHTIIVVTHEPSAAAAADRILFLADGKLVRDEGGKTVQEILDLMKLLA